MVCMCSLMSKSPPSNQVKNPPLILIAFCLRLVVLPGFKILFFFSHTQLTQSSNYSHHILSKTGGVAWLQNTVFFFPTLSLHNTEKQMHDCLIEALIVDLMCWAAQSWCPQSALTIPALWSASGNMATWQGNLSRSMFRLPKQQEIMLERYRLPKFYNNLEFLIISLEWVLHQNSQIFSSMSENSWSSADPSLPSWEWGFRVLVMAILKPMNCACDVCRKETVGGRKVLARRLAKGRRRLSA